MWRFLGGAFALPLLVLMVRAVGDAAPIGVGVNYNWWKFTLMSRHACEAQGQPRTVGAWILPAYDRPNVRQTARRQLSEMHRAGFTTLRVIVFYGHDSKPDPSAFTSLNGDVATADKAKLRDFVHDIAKSGFRSLEVVPDFGADNALYCRNREWGDCFDPRRTGENWRFISQVAQTAFAAAGTMRVRVDLANEKAPDPAMSAPALAHAKSYLQAIAGRFQARFGSRWLISAARSLGSSPIETSNRLNLLVADLAEVRLAPRYLELHEYSENAGDLEASLDAMEALAQKIGAYAILGELRYHSAAQAAAISQWIARNPESRLIDLMQWPEYDPSRSCEINPLPPYTPGPLGDALRQPR
jgi:hypothetical protein